MWFSGEEPVLNKSIQARFWKGLLVLFVLFLGFPQMVEGSPGPLKLEVYPGFDGEMKGDWVPVRVKITNSGARRWSAWNARASRASREVAAVGPWAVQRGRYLTSCYRRQWCINVDK